MELSKFRSLTPYGPWVLAVRDENNMQGILQVPDSFVNRSPYSQVVKFGHDVPKPLRRKGAVFVSLGICSYKKDWFRVDEMGDKKFFFIPWDKIQAIFSNGRIMPLGDRVLVKRRADLNTRHLNGGVLSEPQQWSKVQSLDCEVVQFGIPLTNKKVERYGANIGDICKLKRWEPNMFEVQYRGEYHLIVDSKDLEFKIVPDGVG